MTDPRRELDWLSRRNAGESAALIAHHAGVGVDTVQRVTDRWGPFLRPTRQVGRRQLSDEQIGAWAARWVALRRGGVLPTDIARREGVSHQVVSRATAAYGPFPAAKVVQGWGEARRGRRPVAGIAGEAGVRPATVRRLTQPHAPFPLPGARPPEGVETVASIARRVGLSRVTVMRWRSNGRLPAPDLVTAKGRPVWLAATIERWLESADLAECHECGARCISLTRHAAHGHPSRRPSDPV